MHKKNCQDGCTEREFIQSSVRVSREVQWHAGGAVARAGRQAGRRVTARTARTC